MSGGELYSLVEEYGSLPEDVVRIYVGEIALAIGKRVSFRSTSRASTELLLQRSHRFVTEFLHNAGVVHRDIKATNILLDGEGHAVVIDFGFAKWLSRTQRTNTFCGTPEYMGKCLNRTQSSRR